MKLSALMVNYGTGAFALAAARSLAREWLASDLDPSDLSLIVVDHPAGTDEERWLGELKKVGVRVIHNGQNDGYAGGIQMALDNSSGAPDDFVAILNPDLIFLPGSISALLERLLANPLAGAVAPRAWMDEGCSFQLPSPVLPTAFGELLEFGASRIPSLARRAAARRSKIDWEAWTAETPIRRRMVPGACIFLHRSVALGLEHLLDPSYPLYYEDADLCRRLMRRGLEVELVPDANVLHHGARSSGIGEEFEAGPRARWRHARATYMRKYASAPMRACLGLADAFVSRFPRPARPAHGLKSLPLSNDPPTIPLPVGGPWCLELSLTPTFGFALGATAPSGNWEFPLTAWDWLFAGRYYVRALHTSGRVEAAWTFAKHAPPRIEPIWDVDRTAVVNAIGKRLAGLCDIREGRNEKCA
jgi:GT2 family glycosyltransferase